MNPPKTLTNFIWYFIKKQKGYFIAIQILALAWSLDNTAWPYGLKLLIDKLLAFTGDKSEIWYYLMPILFLLAGIWITLELMFRAQGFIMAYTFPRFEADIRMAMFRYVQDHSYDYFANNFAGNISNKISDMTRSSTYIMQHILTLFVPVLIALIIAIAIYYTVNHFFALLLLIWTLIHITTCLLGAKWCTSLANVHSTSRSFLTGKIVDTFTNIINVKLFAKQHYEYDHVNQHQTDERKKQCASLVAVEKIKIALALSSFLIPGVLMTWYQIYSWQHDLITIGDLVLIFYMNSNIMTLAWIAGLELPNLFKEFGVCQQALTIIRAEHDVIDKENAVPLKINKGEIEFDQLNFHYIKGNQVFEDMSVTIEAGSKVGLVGFSGSGKSTFVNLIMRFFDVDSGKILIDGHDISQVTTKSLRSQISMIPQDPTLFHRSIMDNIRYGKVDATDEDVLAASQHAHCDEFIRTLPDGYEALVGERGIKLSGGQRQRIAIARAILKNAPILILDEATSALDSVTEKRVQDALHYLMKDRTTIVIAHRLSTLSKMDRILVFDNGKIIEDGTHQNLLKANGHYAKMWHMQAGGFLPDTLEG